MRDRELARVLTQGLLLPVWTGFLSTGDTSFDISFAHWLLVLFVLRLFSARDLGRARRWCARETKYSSLYAKTAVVEVVTSFFLKSMDEDAEKLSTS
jgi:hypothetical protein